MSSEPEYPPIGPYRIVERLGEGGFGEVFAAEQTEPVRREVAVKVLKRGMDTRAVLARFEAERQALALMDHPHIARILDAGETEAGRPYFVMDLIRGLPITQYCDEKRMGTRDRVQLFLAVCDAVQHAHQKGVIHRDLKPSNILVTEVDGEPSPRVIDFGIAKATHERLTDKTLFTMQGQVFGTPVYMSPEQAGGGLAVDTTSDVYSLGAVLYELLAGAPPFDPRALQEAGLEAIVRILRDDEPTPPSTKVSQLGDGSGEVARCRAVEPAALRGELHGELDWITMTAMDKDPDRRYRSANALAQDLERYLRDEPVSAAPPALGYQARKFVRRHRLPVGLAAVGVLVLAGFAATMAVQAQRIAVERDRANRERDAAERVADFLAQTLGTVEPEAMGLSLWEDLRTRVETAGEERGATPAEVERTLASFDAAVAPVNPTDVALRLLDEEVLARAGATIETELADDPDIAARLRHTFGRTYRDLGLYEQSEPYLRQAIEQRTELYGAAAEPTLDASNTLTMLLQDQGRGEEAEELGRDVLARAEAALGPDHPTTLGAVTNLGVGLRQIGKLEEAEPLYRRSAEGHARLFGEDHDETVVVVQNLGWLLHQIGQYEDGERYTREALEKSRVVYGPDHNITVTAMNNLGIILAQVGRLDEAEVLAREALEVFRRVQGDDHPRTYITLVNLGALLDRQGKLDEAVDVYAESLDGFRRHLGDDHPNTLATMSNYGYTLKTLGRLDEAEAMIGETLERSRRIFGETHLQTFVAAGNLGDLRILQGRPAEAEELLRGTLATARETLAETHWDIGALERTLGLALKAQGRYDEAEELLVHAYGLFEATFGADHERAQTTRAELRELFTEWGRPEQAAEWAEPPAAEADAAAN